MRTVLIAALFLAAPLAAEALPRVVVDTERSVETVQNRFLPGFLGGNNNNNGNNGSRDAESALALRVEQLEAQVRMLTGQVEQLTFSLRRMEAAIGQAGQPGVPGQQQGALTGPGAPPRSLGTLPAGAVPPDPSTSAGLGGGGNTQSGGLQGPLDLSVLNNGGTTTPATTGTTPPPVSNDALAKVRELQATGRYSMAAEEARTVLSNNPDGEVAGEARYLLGESLLAQGDYRGAANQFLENYTNDPNSARAPASLLKLGTALNELGEREATCSSLAEFFGAYPNATPELRAAAEKESRAANCA